MKTKWLWRFYLRYRCKRNLIDYVKNQEAHHKKKTFVEEYKQLLHDHKIEFDEKYLL